MRATTALTVSTLLAFVSCAAFAGSSNAYHHDGLLRQNMDSQMFEGVSLTEHQRQQMRDLMRQARHDLPGMDLHDIEAMHKLVTAETFDAAAVRAQAEKMARESVGRQIEMARIRNQMYNLLTPEQKDQINVRYQQRVEQWQRQMTQLQNASSLKLGTTK
ncbi:cell-envelope stress modulator CpxP [Enterobacillus tribolii]|uniref:Protein CpxP n=1 Tax=Enterobacillus tribolii TaxID=1487935 RepID=A0A370QUE3_9GAMM|nr:cell-envelope stress modulator CpxP [Enterobacillus tribolii]MBW7981088.1 periplasmic heavy metal sensor [Enterobacillus tribolii]RDK92855.1 protein CpxP [Enterobacillus tribolii]